MLPEEVTFDDIQTTVAQARLIYQASQNSDAEACDKAARSYLAVLDRAVTDADAWRQGVDQKIEQVPTGRMSSRGRLPITHPKDGDLYYVILQRRVPFIIDLRKERDELKQGLTRHRN